MQGTTKTSALTANVTWPPLCSFSLTITCRCLCPEQPSRLPCVQNMRQWGCWREAGNAGTSDGQLLFPIGRHLHGSMSVVMPHLIITFTAVESCFFYWEDLNRVQGTNTSLRQIKTFNHEKTKDSTTRLRLAVGSPKAHLPRVNKTFTIMR